MLAPIGESSVKVSELRNKFYNSLPTIRNAIYDSLVSSGYYLERPDKVKGNGLSSRYSPSSWAPFSERSLRR